MQSRINVSEEWDSQSEYTPLCGSPKKIKQSTILNKLQSKMHVDPHRVSHKTKQSKGEYFWNETENIKYRQFVEKNIDLLMKPLRERKALKINIMMSKFIKTRTASQCRSHHQKMLNNHENALQLLEFLKGCQPSQKVEREIQIEQQVVPPVQTSPELKFIEQTQGSSSSLWESLISSADLTI